MFDSLISILSPHPCYNCGKIGAILCGYCKYNIINDETIQCISCGTLSGDSGVCKNCNVVYERAWLVGERTGELERIINDFKFNYMYEAHKILSDLLVEKTGYLPKNTVIVPIPTVASHVRHRGYDHTKLIAKHIAKKKKLNIDNVLKRATNTKQLGASKRERMIQAKQAFAIDKQLDPTIPYLIIDDVVTTGSTLHYASKVLYDAGARHIWVAAIARQPID